MSTARARFEQVEQLLDEVLALPEAAREAALAARCDDAELRAQVRRLLGAERRLGDFMEPVAAPALPAPPTVSGTRFGAWRILRLLGRGGMGEVYLAERADGAYAQRGALKIVATPYGEDRARFYAERQILAALEHPGIARLLDGGLADDGRPYMVMEYVEGVDLLRHCTATHASLAERLRLFRDVCAAVAYAHRHLVVHRDLKPGNILVAADGTAKLLDFGVAKLLDPSRPGPQATQTLQLTPAYAAPEQLEGRPTTTATDVHALGVILYELLTGAPPWKLSDLPLASAVARVLHAEPPPPSRVAGAIARRALAGDLDAIVARALARRPEERYASAAELLQDLERHARHEPVAARQQSLGYVASRFVRKHRLAVASGGAVLLALVAALALSLSFYVEARAERDRAERAAATARAVNDFLSRDLLASARLDQAPTRDITLRELLDAAAALVDERFAEQPETALSVHDALGDSYYNLSLYEASRRHRERALEIATRLQGRDGALALDMLAKLAALSGVQGRYGEALALFAEAQAGLARLHGPGYARLVPMRVEAAEVAYGAGEIARAAEEVRALLDTPALADQLSPEDRLDTLGRLGTFEQWLGNFARAEELQRAAMTGREKLLGAEHLATAASRLALASVLLEQGRIAEAEPEALRAHADVHRWVGPDDAFVAYAESVLGRLRMEQARPQQAEPSIQNALRIRIAAFGANTSFVAWTRFNLAECLQQQGRVREALHLMEQALAVADRTDGPANPFTARERVYTAGLLRMLGRTAQAQAMLDAIPPAAFARLPAPHPFVGMLRLEQGQLLRLAGRRGEARAALDEALAIHLARYGADHRRTREARAARDQLSPIS